jgi:acetyl esterase/lipase
MPSLRHLVYSVVLLGSAANPHAEATEAGKLLPADTKMVVTLNLRQILSDHRNTEFVQRYLDQWRLALKGDEQQLKNYFRRQELDKSEGISEQEFLARAKIIKKGCDVLGLDPLEDLDRITFGYSRGRPGQANEAGSFILIVEGRFNPEKFKAAIQQLAKDYFGSFKVTPTGDAWQIPDGPDGMFVSLLDGKTLAITSDKKSMDELRARAGGKTQDGLPKGMRTLLDSARKEQAGIVVADVDQLLKKLASFLKDDVAKAIDAKDAVGKLIVTQGAGWIQKYANDISSVGLGLSLREDDFRLQIGLDAKKPATAKELHMQIQRGTFWGALALKAFDNELAQEAANILVRQRLTLKETTVIMQTEISYDFVKLVLKGPGLVLMPKDFAPAGAPEPKAELAGGALDGLWTRITSIPLWTVPARDKAGPLPAGTYEILEAPGVAYQTGPADPIRHRLDMYLPKNKKDFPVLVLVHGGAWDEGDNRCCGLYSSVGQFFASQGIGVVLPNYRLFPNAKHPEQAKDVARAVAWTHANIAKYGGDPRRLYLSGHSAGGHLATLLAADESYLQFHGMKATDIQGVIGISGVYHVPAGVMRFSLGGSGPRAVRYEQMFPLRGDSPQPFKYQLPGFPAQLNMFAPIFGDTPRQCELASPLTHVHRGMPPLLILVAEHDLPTLPEMASEFQQALLQKGCAVRLLKVAKRNHNSLLFSAIRPDDPAAQAMLEFLRK